MRFAWAPPGEFFMERPTDELEPEWNENPSAVRIRQGFFIGVHPVTQAQWQALMGTNPARFRGSDHPVEMISWDDAVTFCRRLSERGTGTYRLPTEVEWEYACRAGDCGRLTHPRAGFSVGSLSPRATAIEFGHVGGNCEAPSGVRPRLSEKVGHPTVGDSGGTQPVGQRGPNPWGLFDTGGNVWEWCADASGPAGAHLRVLRGGSWFDPPERCGVAARLAYDRAAATSAFGLRVVLEG
jgi:formylglycine-generating enzyme required for sulfatase activity